MTLTFTLPDLGEGLTEAEIVAWRVAEGDNVGVDDIVVEVETAKAAVEVPCPYAGTVVTLHGSVGDMVPVGRPLLTVEPNEDHAGSGAVLVGYGTEHGDGRRRHGRGRAPSTEPSPGAAEKPERSAPRVISPVVRRLARDRGLDVARLAGSGPDGLVLRRDVESALTAAPVADDVPTPAATDEVRIRLRGVRRAAVDTLTRSRREIPDTTTWVDADATGLVEARDALRAAYPDCSIGLLALLARFVVAGLRRHPELNARVEHDGDTIEIVQPGHVNLGFAAQTDRGLVVPVVRDAHRMTTLQLADELTRLTGSARDGRIGPRDLTGGTFTLNNYGVFGVDGSTPIINHPEAALLGVGRIVDKPWVVDGELAVRKVTQLSLTFDHRVCDGGVAGGFLRFVADCVERPLGLLAEL
ncbi:MAG TPA: dihydrolipoamide acetyltransferase family protein [Jiangellaceae bacterium]|nr:dihydrolipoamide acetyltransferase family protein [Jiangellaceae bacterium]